MMTHDAKDEVYDLLLAGVRGYRELHGKDYPHLFRLFRQAQEEGAMPNGITDMRGNVLNRMPEEIRKDAARRYDLPIHVWTAWAYAWSYR